MVCDQVEWFRSVVCFDHGILLRYMGRTELGLGMCVISRRGLIAVYVI